jgi:Phosphotransferase enzyme family
MDAVLRTSSPCHVAMRIARLAKGRAASCDWSQRYEREASRSVFRRWSGHFLMASGSRWFGATPPASSSTYAVKPWQVVAEIAAAIHAVTGRDVAGLVPGYETRAAHARAALAVFEGLAPIVHGDLLGQNILLAMDGPHHVIDWEYATRGDPAYDLAIVTRGVKQPFQIAGGLDRLLDAYRAHSGLEVSANQVHLHELCLIAGLHRAAVMGEAPPALGRVRSLLRRLR